MPFAYIVVLSQLLGYPGPKATKLILWRLGYYDKLVLSFEILRIKKTNRRLFKSDFNNQLKFDDFKQHLTITHFYQTQLSLFHKSVDVLTMHSNNGYI